MKRCSTIGLMITLGTLDLSNAATADPAHKAVFQNRTSSKGWIDFDRVRVIAGSASRSRGLWL